MDNLKNQVVVITGAGQGLGEATARVLSADDAVIVCVGDKESKLKRIANEIESNGKVADSVVIDVANPESINAGIDLIERKYQRIDVLINNAGLDVEPKPIEEYTLNDFDKVINVNLRGPFLLIRKVLPIMYRQNTGHIINVGSTASIRTWPNASLYHMSKAALRGLSWSLFTEIREKKAYIRVSTLIPGGMKTTHVIERFPNMDFSWMQDPIHVAKAIKFMLLQPIKSVIPELLIIPPMEWSLP